MRICYTSPADKAAQFRAVTIPSIFAAARAPGAADDVYAWLSGGHGVTAWPRGVAQLTALHAAARQGLYVPDSPQFCDEVQPVAETIYWRGGDCDQWAAVLLAALETLGYPARLVTYGNSIDPFQHVAVTAYFGLRWYVIDPKGDQRGNDFDSEQRWPVRQEWTA